MSAMIKATGITTTPMAINLIGEQTIDNVKVYFKDSGVQVKGHLLRMDIL